MFGAQREVSEVSTWPLHPELVPTWFHFDYYQCHV